MAGADDLRRQLDRPPRRQARAEAAPERPAEPAARPVPATDRPPRTRKVRMTIDLVPQEFEDFRDWRNSVARQLQRGRVNGSDVMIALLRRLMVDEALQRDIVEVIDREGRR